MQIQTFVLGELQTNCYLVYDSDTNEGIVIDPADEANFIVEQILSLAVRPIALIATHGHFDHILAANELQLAFSIPLLLNENDMPIVKYMQKSAEHWLKREIIEKPPEKIKFLKDKDKIKFANEKLEVIATPGHSPGGICLYSAKNSLLFTGDTLFSDGAGRTDLSYGSPAQLAASLKKLSRLPPETLIYPGHGPKELILTVSLCLQMVR